jgi:hypothetical protein
MVSPTGREQFELKPQTTPRVRVEGGVVYARLELSRLNETRGHWDVEILLPPKIANELGAELLEAAKKAS